MATVSQLQIEETSRSLLSLPTDFYGLIILDSIRSERAILPVLEHFPKAIHIALNDIASFISPYYTTVFTYTLHDVFETGYAQPPNGFVSTRLAEIAEIHLGGSYKSSPSDKNNTHGSPTCYLITPKNIQAEGVLLLDKKSVIGQVDVDEQLTLKPDDILLATFTTGVRNRVALIPESLSEAMTFNNSLIRIRVDRKLADPKAVFAFLQSDTGQRLLLLLTSGTLVPRLTVRDLASMQIFLPKNASIMNEAIELSAAMRAIHEIQNRISLAERVTNEFPTPIALAYRRFRDARFDIYQQLLRLRDLFEAAIYYIYHVILADTFRYLDPSNYFVEDRGIRGAFNIHDAIKD